VILKARPLSEESLAQPLGGAGTTVEFRNHSSGEIQLFWLPGDGRHVPYGTVAPGAVRMMHTYAYYYWLITGKDGKPITIFVGETAPGIAEIH
jgi:hypothetical protein